PSAIYAPPLHDALPIFLAWAALAAGAGPAAALLNGGPELEEILPWRGANIPLAALLVVPTARLMREGGFRALAVAESVAAVTARDRKSTRLNSSHVKIS